MKKMFVLLAMMAGLAIASCGNGAKEEQQPAFNDDAQRLAELRVAIIEAYQANDFSRVEGISQRIFEMMQNQYSKPLADNGENATKYSALFMASDSVFHNLVDARPELRAYQFPEPDSTMTDAVRAAMYTDAASYYLFWGDLAKVKEADSLSQAIQQLHSDEPGWQTQMLEAVTNHTR